MNSTQFIKVIRYCKIKNTIKKLIKFVETVNLLESYFIIVKQR